MTKEIYSFEYKHSTNLGDEIQTLAAMNVISKLGFKFGGVVDRNNPQTERKINLLVNGYIEHYALNFKTEHPNINPIFSNLHLANISPSKLGASLNKLKPFQPISCRDRWTTELLKKHGIDAFFNYCLTLTFDKRESQPTDGKIFIVDLNGFVSLPPAMKKEQLVHVTHVSGSYYSHQTRMLLAQELLDLYKREAKLIITGRLHCALPCVAMGIPVIMFSDPKDPEAPRLKLAEEFIPVYPYYAKELVLSNDIVWWTKRMFVIVSGLAKNLYYRIKYRKYHKKEVNWQPPVLDIEDLKKEIITRVGEQIKRAI